KTVVVHEAEKNRAIDVSFGAASTGSGDASAICALNPEACKTEAPPTNEVLPPAKERSSGVSASAIVLGAIGVVGLAGFAYYGIKGKHDVDVLRSTCAPACDQADVDAAKHKLLFAD